MYKIPFITLLGATIRGRPPVFADRIKVLITSLVRLLNHCCMIDSSLSFLVFICILTDYRYESFFISDRFLGDSIC